MSHTRAVKATIVVLSLVAVLLWLSAATALASCTGLYLGKDTTENGTCIWGRSEDVSATYSKIFYVQPAETHAPGTRYVSSTGFSWPYPAQTFRYTLTPDSVYNENQTPQPFAEVGMNENGVAISGTVSISAIASVKSRDPLVRSTAGGLPEQDLVSVVLMQATSARHAVELVAEIVDTVGSAESNAFTISDPDEVWYMEILTGHQYVAVKSPSDKIAFSPNIMMLDAVDVTDAENVVASPRVIEVAELAGTLKTDAEGRILVAQSYSTRPGSVSGRMYLGYYYLKGVDAARALPAGYYPYFIEPRAGDAYSLYEAMRFLAYHGNPDDPLYGKYVANPSGNSASIGNAGTVESHVFEIRYDMPQQLATVQWMTMGPAEFSIYLPYYANLITETFANYYAYDSPRTARDYRSMYWLFRDIYILCNANRGNVAPNVSALLEQYQKTLIEQQKVVDTEMARIYACSPEVAQEKATALSVAAAEQAFNVMTGVRDEILAYNADPDPDKGVFTPSALNEPIDTKYTLATVNRPPAADAGPDQTIEQTSVAGAGVTLDFRGSSDPDCDQLAYAWKVGDQVFADDDGLVADVVFPVGETTVTLVVNDGYVDSEQDSVVIAVTPATVAGLGSLIDGLPASALNPSVKKLLQSQVKLATAVLGKGQTKIQRQAATLVLKAIVVEVKLLPKSKITQEARGAIVDKANAVIANLKS